MIGISKQGCLKLARYHSRELVRARKSNQWGIVMHSRLMRDSYIHEARARQKNENSL